uniref:Uncharacterized protein n=1 Tax=Rhizophora mucronata TaxID=61149 RepID=A0A2P2NRP1_RHIMU
MSQSSSVMFLKEAGSGKRVTLYTMPQSVLLPSVDLTAWLTGEEIEGI